MTIGMTTMRDMLPEQRKALKEHLKGLGLNADDRKEAYRALCFLADHGDAVIKALGRAPDSISEACQGLRVIVDGKDGEFW